MGLGQLAPGVQKTGSALCKPNPTHQYTPGWSNVTVAVPSWVGGTISTSGVVLVKVCGGRGQEDCCGGDAWQGMPATIALSQAGAHRGAVCIWDLVQAV